MKLSKTAALLTLVIGVYTNLLAFSPAQSADNSKDNVTNLPAGVKLLKNISYGNDPKQKMDVYIPIKKATTLAPVIFMVHGGGWRNGDKAMTQMYENKMSRWVPKGFIFVSINYPMLPDTDVFNQEANVQLALATAQQLSEKWGGNPSKFIVMGHSAGAHLVSLMNDDPSKAYAKGARPWLGTVSLEAPLNIVSIMNGKYHQEVFDNAFGTNPLVWNKLSPYQQLTPSALNWLGVCGTILGSCQQNKDFVEKSKSLRDHASYISENLDHEEINDTLGLPGPYTDSVETFMASLDKDVARLLSRK